MPPRLHGPWIDYGSPNGSYSGGTLTVAPVTTYEGNVAKKSSVMHWGYQWASGGVPRTWATQQPSMQRSWDDRRIVLLDWFNWDLANHQNDYLMRPTEIINGATVLMPDGSQTIDAYLTAFFTGAKGWAHPFIIRMFGEVNGFWGNGVLPYQIGTGTQEVAAGGNGLDVTSITASGTTYTVTLGAAPATRLQFEVGQRVWLKGNTPTAYNGVFTVATKISATQFTCTGSISNPGTTSIAGAASHAWTNTAQGHIDAWRHIVTIARNVGALNVAFMWNPNIQASTGGTSAAFTTYYPGDAYVDWLSLDGYNDYRLHGTAWLTATQVFRGGTGTSLQDSYAHILALDPTGKKPFSIPETGSWAGDVTQADSVAGAQAIPTVDRQRRADWYTDFLGPAIANNMPRTDLLSMFWTRYGSNYWTPDYDGSLGTTVDTVAYKNGVASGTVWLGAIPSPQWPPRDLTPLWKYTDTAPTFSNIQVSGIGPTSATITWDTSTVTDTQLDFGTSTAYGTTTALADTSPLVLSHSVTLTGLTAGATYFYRVRGTDSWNNLGTQAGPSSFTATSSTGGGGSSDTYLAAEAAIAGRVGHWRLGDASKAAAATMADVLNALPGTYRGTVADAPSLLPSTVNRAAQLTGAGWGEVLNTATLSPQAGTTGRMTLTAWWQETGPPTATYTLVAKGDASGSGQYEYEIFRSATGVQVNLYTLGGGTYLAVGYGFTPAPNAPHRIDLVFDTAPATGNLLVYVDGVLRNGQASTLPTDATTGAKTYLTAGTGPFNIGRRGDNVRYAGTATAPVVVDEVILRNVALTAAQISSLYSAALTPADAYMQAEAAAAGRAHHWALGDASKANAAVAADDVGTLNGTYTGTTATDVASIVPNSLSHAMRIDGASYVTVADNASLSPQVGASGAMTLTVWWLESAAPAATESLVSKAAASQYEYAIQRTPTSVFGILWTLGGGTYSSAGTPFTLTPNVVHRADFVVDMTQPDILTGATVTGTRKLAFYVDGVLHGYGDVPGATLPADGTGPFTIGRRGDNTQTVGTVASPVTIEHVVLRNVALTAAQVQTLYAAGLTTTPISTSTTARTTATTEFRLAQPLTTTSASKTTAKTAFSISGAPPVIGPITVSAVTTNSAQVTWTTNIASSSQVDYGATSAYGSSTPLNSTLVTSHVVNLTGLTSGAIVHFRVRSAGAGGLTAVSSDQFFQVATPTTLAITNFALVAAGTNRITLTWTTNQPADSQVDYGASVTYGLQSALTPTLDTTHLVVLTGLQPNTTYHVRARSRDATGSLALSGDLIIRTAGQSGRIYTWIEPNGTAHVLDPSSDPDILVIQGSRGHGTPPTQWLEDRIPQHDGPLVRQVLYDAREIEIPLLVTSPDYSSLLTKTRLIRQWMNVKAGDGTLQIADPDGTIRQFTCRLKQGLEGQEGQDVSGPTWRRLVLVFRTTGSDPWARAPSPVSLSFTQAAAAASWFPFFPIVLGGAGIFANPSIDNPGDFEAEPIWTLVGPMTNPTLTNTTTGAKIALTLALLTGQTLTIDTRFRIKTVLRNDGTKLFSALSNDSSLWPLVPGRNVLSIVTSGTSTASQVQLSFTARGL
jgi:phage-related protein